MVVSSIYSININSEIATKIDFSKFYRKEFKIILDVFTTTVNNHLQRMITLLKPFHETFRILADKKNFIKT